MNRAADIRAVKAITFPSAKVLEMGLRMYLFGAASLQSADATPPGKQDALPAYLVMLSEIGPTELAFVIFSTLPGHAEGGGQAHAAAKALSIDKPN